MKNTCHVASETPAPTEGWPERRLIKTTCGDETHTRYGVTSNRRDVTCTKCLEKLAKVELKDMVDPLHLSERIDLGYDFRTAYHLINEADEVVGVIRLPNGWGHSWQVCKAHQEQHGLRFKPLSLGRIRTKTSAVIVACNHRDKLITVTQAEQEYQERVARAKIANEHVAENEKAEKKHISETIEGLTSVLENKAANLSNSETTAVHDAIDLIKKARW